MEKDNLGSSTTRDRPLGETIYASPALYVTEFQMTLKVSSLHRDVFVEL